MKKKTKARLDRIEKRLQQLVEDLQELKKPTHGKESVKEKGPAAETTGAKNVATKKVGKPRKTISTKKVAVTKKAEAAPGTATAKKTVTKLAQPMGKNKVAAKS
ncbi:MAG: hypothetical protein ABI856_13660 [Nitrospira sp.]